MRSTRITASFLVCLGVALAASPALALYHHWSGSGKAGVFDDPANWGISQADAFSKASCKPGCESQIGDNPSLAVITYSHTLFCRLKWLTHLPR